MSTNESESPTPKDADIVVRQNQNNVYNPVVSTEEVAEKLDVSIELAHELLSEAQRPESKEVGDSHVWW